MMKYPRINRKRQLRAGQIVLIALAVLLFSVGMLWASSGGAAAETGWKMTDTYKLMNFAVLAVALFLLLRKPLSAALGGRIEGIREELKSLEEEKEAARQKLESYNERLAKLDQEAAAIIDNYKKQGEAAKARILEDAQASARKIEDQAQRNIENEFNLARQKLEQDVFEKAVLRAEEMLKTKITAADQEKLVDEYLEKVVAQ